MRQTKEYIDKLREIAVDHRDGFFHAGLDKEVDEAADELQRLDQLINNPHIHEFLEAVRLEAAHQQERWGTEHDEGKAVNDWFWLIAYLATKATQAERYGDREKYLHHIITTAAACANWHANVAGANRSMRPGAPTPED